jgi:hypothetical protein
VGAFTGAAAGRASAPAPDGADVSDAYRDCVPKVDDYLGGPWQSAYVRIGISVPGMVAWRGGARWYLCQVIELSRDLNKSPTNGHTSARDGLRGTRPLARTCALALLDEDWNFTRQDGIDCAQPHNAEFAGLYSLNSLPSDENARDAVAQAACLKLSKAFIGIKPDNFRYFGYWWDNVTAENWRMGVHTGRCYVLAFVNHSPNTVRFTGSVKGIGDRKPTGWHT